MNPIIEKTTNILSNLSDLQPSLSLAGLERELEIVNTIKRDVADMMSGFEPAADTLELLLEAKKTDLLSVLEAMFENLPTASKNVTDEQLQKLRLGLEFFKQLYDEYLALQKLYNTTAAARNRQKQENN